LGRRLRDATSNALWGTELEQITLAMACSPRWRTPISMQSSPRRSELPQSSVAPRHSYRRFFPATGARPFHQAPTRQPHLLYNRRRLNAALSGYSVSRRDDSTFLRNVFSAIPASADRNLVPATKSFDLSAGYAVTSYAKILYQRRKPVSQHYQALSDFRPRHSRSTRRHVHNRRPSGMWK